MKNHIWFFFICMTLVGFLSLGCSVEKETYLLPFGYEGKVIIEFNFKEGKPTEWENGRRLYRIPQSGVLKTTFDGNYGSFEKDDRQYFFDSFGIRIPIHYGAFLQKDSFDSSEIYILRTQIGGVPYGKDQGGSIWFFVCKPKDLNYYMNKGTIWER